MTNKKRARKIKVIIFFLLSFLAITSYAAELPKFAYPFYVGIASGYGSTMWQGLVPLPKNENAAMTMSTPIHVNEGGTIWGVFAGYELIPYFALEANYVRYPTAKVSFDPTSLFTFEHNGTTMFHTHTETVSLIGKIMLMLPETTIRIFSGAGPTEVHRYDEIKDHWCLSPTFALGVNYNFTPHIMTELGGTYTAGYGNPELDPVESYFPFLYSIYLHLAYRF